MCEPMETILIWTIRVLLALWCRALAGSCLPRFLTQLRTTCLGNGASHSELDFYLFINNQDSSSTDMLTGQSDLGNSLRHFFFFLDDFGCICLRVKPNYVTHGLSWFHGFWPELLQFQHAEDFKGVGSEVDRSWKLLLSHFFCLEFTLEVPFRWK